MKMLRNNKSFVLLMVLVASFALLLGASNLTTQQILNASYDSDTNRLQIGIAVDTLKDSTALTNTVTYPLTLEHETSGTPAAGIGGGVAFRQQTAAANKEVVAGIAAVMTDVTATSEDAKLSFYTMTAGAAMTEVASISSTGALDLDAGVDVKDDITLENDETISNSVNGTIALGGAVTVSNDFAVDTDVFSIDATNDIVEINGFWDSPYQAVASTPYTITAASKASYYVINYSDTGAASVVIGSGMAVDGRILVVKDGELNAASNNITISTEGADTIDEAATYVINANGESVTLLSDGTNWFVMGAYGE